jgi:lipooligosaccharide transport system ATP-binding protein
MTGGSELAPAVVATGLRKSYDGRVAVDGIDFVVEQGSCFGFLGPNGAGKTSTMKMIYGLGAIDGGELAVLGMDAARERRAVKQRLGVVPQETNLDGELTVRENLLYHARYFGIDPAVAARRADELLEFSLLDERDGDRVWALSGGMKRRLLVARALINEPELVVLDEPTTGLDPQARLAVWRALDRLKRSGVTLLTTGRSSPRASPASSSWSTSAARCSSCGSRRNAMPMGCWPPSTAVWTGTISPRIC